MMDIKSALSRIADQRDLTQADMQDVMRQIMSGQATDAQIGAFLMGMRMKDETVDEITGAVTVMRELVTPVQVSKEYLVDIVGTGGDGSNLFNVSTAASFVVAAAGGRVAKHGNRSVSSNCGSADLFDAAGVKLGLEPSQVAHCIDTVGVGFMYAPAHHAAMKHAIGPRRELGARTLFNILGPMTNPAGVRRMLIGVYDAGLCRPVAEVLNRLGAEHAIVVHSADGLDEISIAASTHVTEVHNGVISDYVLSPEEVGIERRSLQPLIVESARQSLELIRAALTGVASEQAESARRIIVLNAGAALYVAGRQASIEDGVAAAQTALHSGDAWKKLNELAAVSSSF